MYQAAIGSAGPHQEKIYILAMENEWMKKSLSNNDDCIIDLSLEN